MSQPTSPPDADDELLLQFQQEHETAPDRAAHVKQWCVLHPHLARRIQARANVVGALGQARPETSEPMPAKLGEFEMRRRLGVSMGEVFEAWQPSLNRRVAIKTIRRGRISPQARDRFLREQHVLAGLHQTHIVPIHAAGEEDGLQYFVMPYIDGAALHHVVSAARSLDTGRPDSKTPPLKELAKLVADQEGRGERGEGRAEADRETRDEGRVVKVEGPASPLGRGDEGKGVERSTFNFESAGDVVRRSGALLQHSRGPALSVEYFQSVAQVMADAADALQHAHDANIIHRDLKPSNLMVDRQGHCWIIDFGLAGILHEANQTYKDGAQAAPLACLTNEPSLTTTGIMGTPPYMAPEQWESGQARVNARTDVYGLGVTMYELLTLQRAYDGSDHEKLKANVLAANAPKPREVTKVVPADLDAICRKAMGKEAGTRYAGPSEMAEDLRRWLRFEPTRARPARAVRRVTLWSRRNPGWAAAMLLLFVCIGLGIWSALSSAAIAEEKAKRAEEIKQVKEQELIRLETRRKKELALQEIQRIRLSSRRHDWFDTVMSHVKDAAKLGADFNLRNQSAACLIGLDGKHIHRKENFGGSSVAFDDTGKRLLVGGYFPGTPGAPQGQAAAIWDLVNDTVQACTKIGAGPVRFTRDGTSLQLTVDPESLSADLWDVAKNVRLQQVTLLTEAEMKSPGLSPALPVLALSEDGAFAAASTALRDKHGKEVIKRLVVFDTSGGKVIFKAEENVSALCFAPDNSVIACGREDGEITLRSLPKGEIILSLNLQDRAGIRALALRRDRRRRDGGRESGWLVAAGAGATITVWDCTPKLPRSICRGSTYDVHAVAFSPDGMTLASAGRGAVRLWDVATGKHLIDLNESTFLNDVTFSPDGKSLAVASMAVFGYPARVTVWRPQDGHGVQTLRGLTEQIEHVAVSPDDRYLAALSHDNQLGVWDLQDQRLLHVFDVPRASWVDNAGIMFSPDSRLVAYAGSGLVPGRGLAKGQARVWMIADGKEVSAWTFAPGLQNRLAYHPEKHWMLFQTEDESGKYFPPRQRVGRIYQLKPGVPEPVLLRKLKRYEHFDWPILPEDGRFVALVAHEPQGVSIKVLDTVGDKELGSTAPLADLKGAQLGLDRGGQRLTVLLDTKPGETARRAMLYQMPAATLIGMTEFASVNVKGYRPDIPYYVAGDLPPHTLVRRGQKHPALQLGLDVQPTGLHQEFAHSKAPRFAWGNRDGTVNFADIPAVLQKLTETGLEW